MNYPFRITPTRQELINIFASKTKPLTVVNLLSLLSTKSILVNKTTVYRELDFLLEQGLIQVLLISSGKKYYESTKLDHHHHIICTDCGIIEDVVLKNDLVAEQKRLEIEKGFKINNHSLEFFGLCSSCN